MSSYFLLRNYSISSYEKIEKEAKLDEQNLCGGTNYYKSDYIKYSLGRILKRFMQSIMIRTIFMGTLFLIQYAVLRDINTIIKTGIGKTSFSF